MVSSKRLPKKSNSPSKYVAVPGKIMNWILKEGGKDIKNQLENCQNKSFANYSNHLKKHLIFKN